VGKGIEVHAGSELRKRIIVLDEALLADPEELRRILLHEVAHFVWIRLSNHVRASYEELLAVEFEKVARGELGWSSESRKAALGPGEIRGRTPKWRRYVCESFCDTAAWFWSGLAEHDEFTLAPRFRRRRRDWLAAEVGARARLAV
jgi:hypothetical protein